MQTNSLIKNNRPQPEYVTLAIFYSRPLSNFPEVIARIQQTCADILGCVDLYASTVDEATASAREFRARLGERWDWLNSLTNVYLVNNKPVSRTSKLELQIALNYEPHTNMYDNQSSLLNLTFGLTYLSDSQIESLDSKMNRLFNDAHSFDNTPYGLIDCGDRNEIAFGRHYSSALQACVRLPRKIEKHLWIIAGRDQVRYARGVFWGNLFGLDMVKRLGGADSLIEGFVHATTDSHNRDRERAELTAKFDDGSVLLKLSPEVSPLYGFPGAALLDGTVERGAWLYRKLAEARLLIGM